MKSWFFAIPVVILAILLLTVWQRLREARRADFIREYPYPKGLIERLQKRRPGLPASGMFLVNPPYTLEAALREALPQMAGLLAQARAVDGVTVAVTAPTDPGARIGLLARIENLELTPGSAPAKVVVNSRTGTVVIGQQVRVGPAAAGRAAAASRKSGWLPSS